MSNQDETKKNPKVFVSYSWTSESHQTKVRELSERLKNDGIKVKLDVWKLKPGQDKNQFMEKCVKDETICNVIIICNSEYTKKQIIERQE